MTDISTWTVKRLATGISYGVTPDGSYVNFKANEPSEAGLYFTPEEAKNIFTEEDDIELYINVGGGATRVFRGFIDDKGMKIAPGDMRQVYVHVVDWGSYLAGKRIFEKQYWRSKTVKDVFIDSAARVTDGTTTLSDSAVDAIATAVKREFFATQVKEAWRQAGLDGGADYFVDTSRATPTLNAFAHDSKSLQTGGANYKIVDYAPALAKEIMRDPNFEWNYFRNVAQRFRSVNVTNGIVQTFPAGDINKHMSLIYREDTIGKQFSRWFQIANKTQYDVNTTSTLPVTVIEGNDALDANGAKFTIAQFNIASTATDASINFRPYDIAGSSSDLVIPAGDFVELRLFIRDQLSGPARTQVNIRLLDNGPNFWERNILSDLNTSNWTFVKYDLPTTTSNNGWTKTGTPTTIRLIVIEFRHAGGSTGYTANSSVSLAWFHLFTRQRSIVTGGGTPATEKIITDKSLQDPTTLTNYATAEQARSNVVSPRASCVCDSNLAFIKPGYKIDINFTSTLESTSTGTLRMAEIKHFLWRGYSKMALSFSRPYARV